jgi:hypothetical protein
VELRQRTIEVARVLTIAHQLESIADVFEVRGHEFARLRAYPQGEATRGDYQGTRADSAAWPVVRACCQRGTGLGL